MVSDIIKLAARELRKNSTKAEVILWNHLKWRQLVYKFNRQAPLYCFTEDSWLDRYIIPDFYCKQKKLIIEIDWNIHNNKDIYNFDREKEKIIQKKWIKILRITNDEIYRDIHLVISKIKLELH